MRLRNMNCVRFLHRALPLPRAGSESTAGPGSSLNSSPSSGEATPLGDSTVSPLDEMPSFHSRTGCPPPSRYRLRRLRLRSTAPRYRNSASVSLFISSRVVPVTCFARDVYQVHPYRDSCTHPVHDNFYRTSR